MPLAAVSSVSGRLPRGAVPSPATPRLAHPVARVARRTVAALPFGAAPDVACLRSEVGPMPDHANRGAAGFTPPGLESRMPPMAKKSGAKSATKKSASAKPAAKRAKSATAKKSTAKRGAAKAGAKSTAKKSTAGKSTARKATAKKSTAKKSTAKKSTAKKSAAKKSAAKTPAAS